MMSWNNSKNPPLSDKPVLCFRKKTNDYKVCFYIRKERYNNFYYESYGGIGLFKDVTHWQEIIGPTEKE